MALIGSARALADPHGSEPLNIQGGGYGLTGSSVSHPRPLYVTVGCDGAATATSPLPGVVPR